jgi:hypothetical protein
MRVLLAVISLLVTPLAAVVPKKHHVVASHADVRAQVAADGCGQLGQPSCTNNDPTTGFTIHTCASQGHPTVGAVPTTTPGNYTCAICGEPDAPACECTHDNLYNPQQTTVDRYPRPCTGQMTHWCRYQPQYVAQILNDGYRFECHHNDTDTGEQILCGQVGHEACLNIYEGTYSCISPDPKTGESVAAVLWDNDVHTRHQPNAPYLCKVCGTEGGYACDCAKADACPMATPGETFYCGEGLVLIESDLAGKFYCDSPETQEASAATAAPPSTPP